MSYRHLKPQKNTPSPLFPDTPHMKSPWLTLIACLLASCTTGSDYEVPVLDMPAQYKSNGQWQSTRPMAHADRGNWWKVFKDSQLSELMNELNANNQDIKIAEARYHEAAAQVRAVHGTLMPQLDAGLGFSAAQSLPSSGNTPGIKNNYGLSSAASWDTDLWGRIRRQEESARADAEAYAADVASAKLSYQIQLALAYFDIRILDTQRAFYARTISVYKKSLDRTMARRKEGVDSRAAVMQAETQLRSTQSQALELDITRAKLENALAVLLGRPASGFSLPQQENWSSDLPGTPTGLPSTLLERRPDVAASERGVAAANARTGAAQAALYPSFTLNANGGWEQSSFSNWLSSPTTFWSVGTDFIGPVFDGGSRSANVDSAQAAYDASLASYKQTVLNALREVENNLAALRILENQSREQNAALRAARESEHLTEEQYKAGKVSYLDVVTVQAIALTNERNAAQVLNARYTALLNLIGALGGSW